MNGVRRVILVALLFAAVWAPGMAYAASCPYCGRTYGAAMPGGRGPGQRPQGIARGLLPEQARLFLRGRSGRSYTPIVPSGPSPAELERQRKAREATLLNEEGIRHWDQQDFAKAADCFRRALDLDPNRPVIRESLRRAEEILAEQRQQREQARQMDEAKPKVDRMLDELSRDFDGSSGRTASGSMSGSAAAPQPGGVPRVHGGKGAPLFQGKPVLGTGPVHG